MLAARKMTIGSGRPTGPAMPPGRWTGMGRVGSPAHPARLQFVLSLHQQFDGSRRPQPGGLSANLQNACKLSNGLRRLSHVAYQRHPQPSGGSLSPITPRPHDRCARGCPSGRRGKAFAGTHARQGRHGAGIERAGAVRPIASFAGVARSNHLARLAGFGIQRDSAGSFGARRYGKIANQSRARRISAHLTRYGSQALVINEVGE